MATDDRADIVVSTALHRYLGSAVGPDGQWAGAPASRTIAGLAPEPGRSRRWPRASLLLAAGLTVLLAAGAILVSGGFSRPNVLTRPTSAPLTAPTAPPADASPPAAIVASPVPGDAPMTCQSGWSMTGTPPANGLADGIETDMLNGVGGPLFIAFSHPLDTVRGISIAPTQPPFVTSTGKAVKVAGNAFLKMTISGVNKPTVDPDDIVRTPSKAPFLRRMVSAPITEMRRIRTPDYSTVLKAPPTAGSTEVWIIGLDYAPCVRVRTVHEDGGGLGSSEPGDNTILVDFDQPAASATPS